MNPQNSPPLVALFLRVLAARYWIVAIFAILTAVGIFGALRIPTDPSIDRLVIAGDPVARATLEFERVFPEGEQALLLLEAPDPFTPDVLKSADRLEHALDAIPNVAAQSVLSLRQSTDAERLRAFATGTTLFRRAGLVGQHFLGIALALHVSTPLERDRALEAIDALVLPLDAAGYPFTAVRRVGSPWLDAWLERQTSTATRKSMPLFGIFLIALVLLIYRSWRTLAAIVLTLGAVLAMAMGSARIFGWTNTVVSTIVPLTVLVTGTATLVYLHSRFMEPDDAPSLLRAPGAGAGQQVSALHRLDVRDRGGIRGAGGLGDSPATRNGPLDRLRPAARLAELLHAVPGAAGTAAHADTLGLGA
jgi:hypothetical protein